MGIPDHLTCLLRNLYAGEEATVRTGHGTMDWFQTGKGICQGCILSPCLFNLFAEYIMRNTGLDESQAGFRKGRGARDQTMNIHWIIKKAREFQKNIYFCFNEYTKAFDCVDHNKLRKILQEMGIPDHITCLLRNLYAGQAATVRTGDGTMDWFQTGKGVCQGCILSPCLFNLHAEYIIQNGQAGWSISWNQDCWEKCQ